MYEDLWQRMVASDWTGEMISSGSYTGTGNDQDTNRDGLPYNHAFSIMRALEVRTETGSEERLVEIRNPWGSESYWGDWSDSSDRWTDFMRQQVGHYTADDGKFYMSFEDYVNNMEYTDFNFNIIGWKHSAFAVFGDDEPHNRQEPWGDGVQYNVHNLYIMSDVDQEVSLSAHSYHFKHYHGACSEGYYNSEVMVKRQEDEYFWIFNPGSIHGGISHLKAGQPYEVTVYSHFGDGDMAPHDWSIVAWAKDQPVTILREDGRQSDTLRLLDDAGKIDVPQVFDLSYQELIRLGELHELVDSNQANNEEFEEYYQLLDRFNVYLERNGLAGQDPEQVWQDLIDEKTPKGPEAPSFDDLVMFEALFYKPYDQIPDDMKHEYDRIYMELENYRYQTERWDISLIQFVAELLGKDNTQFVELSQDELLHFQDLFYKPSNEMTDLDWADFYLLWVKFDAYIAQNNLWDRDVETLLKEMLGQEVPETGDELTEAELWSLYDFMYESGWSNLDEYQKDDLLASGQKVYDALYQQNNWEMSIADFVLKALEIPVQPEVYWSEEGLRHLQYLYPIPGGEMTEQDWRDWDLLWTKYDVYAQQEGIWESGRDVPEVLAELLGEEYKDPDNTDESGFDVATLEAFIHLHEQLNGEEWWLVSDEDYNHYMNIYWQLEEWLYWEAGIFDMDPVSYAYEKLGRPNPQNSEPTWEELLILEEFYFQNYANLPEDKKAEVDRVINKVIDYMYAQNLWDLTPFEFAVYQLGMGQGEITLSDETLNRFLEIWNKDWDQLTDQDFIDQSLIYLKLDAYIAQNGLWDRDPIVLVMELLGKEPNVIDPTNQYPMDMLMQLLDLNERLTLDPWSLSDEEYNEFWSLYDDLYNWLYYEQNVYDLDPIDYAYMTTGLERPQVPKPTQDELVLLEELFYREWSEIPADMKAQYSDIMNKIYRYMEAEGIWEVSAIEFAAELLGKNEFEYVTLSEEALRHFIDLNNGDFWSYTDEDWLDLELLWLKMDAYIAQNGLWDRDPISLAQELLGEDPSGGGDVTKDDLWQMYDFLFGEGWAVMDNEDKDSILNTYYSLPYEAQEGSQSVIDYLMRELELTAYPEVRWSKEGLNHLIYLYPLPGDQMSAQDWIDWDLLWGKYDVYATQNGLWDNWTDPEQVLYELLGEEPRPVDPVGPIEGGPSKEELYELIELHEKINGIDSWETTDEEWNRYFDLYWNLESFLYYELEDWETNPIDYAYERVGGTNPMGEEPSREELMILEELYYSNWSDLPETMKSEYNRILNKMWNYMEYNGLWDVTPIQLAAEMLGKEAEYVTLSEEALRRLLELYETPWDELSEQEKVEDALLWAKMSAYMAQNDLWDRDAIQVAKELLGDAPGTGVEITEEDLWQLYNFYFSDGWVYSDENQNQKLVNIITAIEEELWAQGQWNVAVAQHVAKKLVMEQSEVFWTEEGLKRLAYLYPLPGDQMTEQDWTDWALLWSKYDFYAIQNGLWDNWQEPMDVINRLLNELNPEPKPDSFEIIDLAGDYGLHMDAQIVYEDPEKSMRASAFVDPDTDQWQWSLQSGSDRVLFTPAGYDEPQSVWTFTDEAGATFSTPCPYETVMCEGEESLRNWNIFYQWDPSAEHFTVAAQDKFGRTVDVNIDQLNLFAHIKVSLEDGTVIAEKDFQIAMPSWFERKEFANKYTEEYENEDFKVAERLDYFVDQQANHTLTITPANSSDAIFEATFVYVWPDENTTNIIIDLGNGENTHIGCSSNNHDSWNWDDEFNWDDTTFDNSTWSATEGARRRDLLSIMPEDECHEWKEHGEFVYEFNRSNDWIYFTWHHVESDVFFTTTVYTQEGRVERVDYWPTGVAVSDWDLNSNFTESSSVELIFEDESNTGVELSYEIIEPGQEPKYISDYIQSYDSTNIHQTLELTDYFSFDCTLQQIIRQNETDRDMVMMLKSDDATTFVETTKDRQLNLAPGFTREEYSFSPDGKTNVDFAMYQEAEGRFTQWITFGETGVCVYQVVDFNTNVWSRELYTDGCSISQGYKDWQFPQGFGPLGYDPAFGEPEVTINYDEVFQQGFDLGFAEAETEALAVEEVDPRKIREYENAMPAWIEEQDLQGSIFTCDSDVRVDHPFIEDDSMWALWAAQDCKDYDLKLTVVLTKETNAKNVGFYGAELDEAGCRETLYFQGAISCVFTVKSDSKFGMLFSGGFSPIYYTTEWVRDVEYSTAFSWW